MGILDFFFKRTLEDIEEKTTRSFSNLRTDMSSVAKWITHFHERHETTEKDFIQLRVLVENQNKNIAKMQEELQNLKKEVYQVQTRFEPRFEPELEPEPEPRFEPAKYAQKRHEKKKIMEERMLIKIRSKTKEYVMNQIIEIISEGDLSTKELETIVVKNKGLCSRTSFYNYIRELKNIKKIDVTEVGLKVVS